MNGLFGLVLPLDPVNVVIVAGTRRSCRGGGRGGAGIGFGRRGRGVLLFGAEQFHFSLLKIKTFNRVGIIKVTIFIILLKELQRYINRHIVTINKWCLKKTI